MAQLNDLDYEAIENAVLETARGRWFLAEYKKRNGVAGSQTLLNAIARLERVITSINKNDLAEPDQKKPTIAKVEPVAAAVATPLVPASFAKTDDSKKIEEPQLSNENLQFFSNDEDLFADDTSAFLPDAIEKTTNEQNLEEKPAVAGNSEAASRVKITRTAKKSDPKEKQSKNKKSDTSAKQVPDVSMSPTNDELDRIVVIRKTADSDIEIPLADGKVSDEEKNGAGLKV